MHFLGLFASLLIAALMMSDTPAVGAKEYGKKLTLKEKTPISTILADPKAFEGKRVLVEGTISDVCKKMGCWVMLMDGEKGLRFKVKDGVIVFSQDLKGKTALAEGTISVRKMSVEEQISMGKHLAEEQGVAFDSTTIKGPTTYVQIQGEGAVIR